MGIYTPRVRSAQNQRNRQIRKQYASGKFTYQDLADLYRITRQRIGAIINSKTMY